MLCKINIYLVADLRYIASHVELVRVSIGSARCLRFANVQTSKAAVQQTERNEGPREINDRHPLPPFVLFVSVSLFGLQDFIRLRGGGGGSGVGFGNVNAVIPLR